MFVEKLPISLHLGTFLPQHAMLARYLLSSCVRPSVCLSVTSPYSIDTIGRIELVCNMEASLHLSYNVLKKIQVAPEIRVRSCELFAQTLDSGSPLQVDLIVNKTRRRRSSLLTTPTRQSTSRGCLLLAGLLQPSNSITSTCCGFVVQIVLQLTRF